jgi:hypothetical protein
MPIRFSRRQSIVRRTGVVAITAFSSSCSCQKPKPPAISVPPLGQVTIAPVTVFAAGGRVFQWRAVVTTPGNRIIDVEAYPEITIKWSSASAASLFPDPSRNPVVVEVPNTPGITIGDVLVTVTRETSPGQATTVTSQPALIRIASAGAATSDRLIVPHASEAPPVAVLLDARTSTDCPMNDWAIAVVGVADLGVNLEPGCSPAPELAAFSRGREIEFRDENAPFKWTSGVDVETVTPAMPEFRSISVVVGVPATADLAWASAEIENVHDLFDENRSGIGIETANTHVHGRTSGITSIAAACSRAALDALLAPGHSMGEPDLFVLFVADITDTAGGVENVYQGLACAPASDHIGRAVYLSISSYLHATLAHELGHTFGLIAPRIGSGGGHSNAIGSFGQDNIMWNATDETIRFNRNRFSIGQLFRMNLDIGSWLNNGGLVSTAVHVRDCQTGTGEGTCPALDKDPG